ncbi:DNA repair protein RadC [Thermocrinis sp.]|uniref:RadC family protein n=1 Tax=Thermocrinis sp. TaxID=2024383 RepID=UPI002FDDA526
MYEEKSIKKLPKDLRPREKLSRLGAEVLSEEELVAIILGSGSKGEDVMSLAKRVVGVGWNKINSMSVEQLTKEIKGLGFAKACQLKAVIELSKRINDPYSGFKISSPQEAYRFVKEKVPLDERREHLIALYLTPTNKVIDFEIVAIGRMNSLYAEPKDILYGAIKNGCSSIIIFHNHPKGEAKPSKEDIEFTRRLKQACQLLGFDLLDHIILTRDDYYSMKANGHL